MSEEDLVRWWCQVNPFVCWTGNRITAVGATTLSRILQNNTTLTILNLSGLFISSNKKRNWSFKTNVNESQRIELETMVWMRSVLHWWQTHAWQNLTLAVSMKGQCGVGLISIYLNWNWWTGNGIKADGAKGLCEMLKKNSTLRTLLLWSKNM